MTPLKLESIENRISINNQFGSITPDIIQPHAKNTTECANVARERGNNSIDDNANNPWNCGQSFIFFQQNGKNKKKTSNEFIDWYFIGELATAVLDEDFLRCELSSASSDVYHTGNSNIREGKF